MKKRSRNNRKRRIDETMKTYTVEWRRKGKDKKKCTRRKKWNIQRKKWFICVFLHTYTYTLIQFTEEKNECQRWASRSLLFRLHPKLTEIRILGVATHQIRYYVVQARSTKINYPQYHYCRKYIYRYTHYMAWSFMQKRNRTEQRIYTT